MKSEFFFYIATIGFMLLTILLSVVLVYAILIARRIFIISKIVEAKVQDLTEAINDAKDFVANGSVIHWITRVFGFRKKKEGTKRSKSQSKDI